MRWIDDTNSRHLPAQKLFRAALVPGAILLSTGCESDREDGPTRTEPWRAEDQAQAASNYQYRGYVTEPHQRLEFDVRGRKQKPFGTISEVEAKVRVPLRALSKSEGQVTIDLSRLQIENEQEPNTPSWTREAHRWLGLGQDAPERDSARQAQFSIESLRELSHEQPWTAPIRKRDDNQQGQIRKIYGQAVGRLRLGSLVVERHIPIWLLFYYSQNATPEVVPEKIVVELRGDTLVPLAEYEIAPRDEQGHVISDQLELLGQEVGHAAHVRGSLVFRRSQSDDIFDRL